MTSPTFGVEILREDNEPRAAVDADLSVIGIIGTAPDATSMFPINTPVSIYSNDTAALEALGADGTLTPSIRLINDQLGDFQAAARVVVVRVAAGGDDDETISNIVGNGTSTGLSAFLRAGPDLGVTPRLICAPGYTHQREPSEANPVCAALPALLSKLLAHAVVLVDPTSEASAIDQRETINSERIIAIAARVKVSDGLTTTTLDASPAVLGIAVRRDFEKGGLPFWSWANQPIQGIVGVDRNVAFSLTDGATEGQTMLAANIGIITRGQMGVDSALTSSGFVFVGTDNAGGDELWRFYNVTRGRDYIHIKTMASVKTFLGRFNITRHTIEAILNTIKLELDGLQAQGAILGHRVTFREADNSPEELRAGRITVLFEAEEAPVLRRITLKSARYRPALEALVADLAAA
jgi:hypothetical protein